jgi:hypothetical protein
MSRISLSGNPSGTGTFTIASPNSNSDRTLTLPDTSATLLTTAGGTLTGGLTMGGLLNLGSTGQIQFPATQNPSSNANTLDDYEEGTFTPSLFASFGSISYTGYTTQNGNYIKIGRMVHCRFQIQVTKSGSGNTGVSGLPFAPAAQFNNGGVYGGVREQHQTGNFFQPEAILSGAQINVLRRYDNGSLPDGVIDVSGFVIYYTD